MSSVSLFIINFRLSWQVAPSSRFGCFRPRIYAKLGLLRWWGL
jgi:hypothetical protein